LPCKCKFVVKGKEHLTTDTVATQNSQEVVNEA